LAADEEDWLEFLLPYAWDPRIGYADFQRAAVPQVHCFVTTSGTKGRGHFYTGRQIAGLDRETETPAFCRHVAGLVVSKDKFGTDYPERYALTPRPVKERLFMMAETSPVSRLLFHAKNLPGATSSSDRTVAPTFAGSIAGLTPAASISFFTAIKNAVH
jgi:hypothetical protein